MKTRTIILGVAILAVGALLIFWRLNNAPKPAPAQNAAVTTTTNRSFVNRVDEQGEVKVEIQPGKIEPKAQSQFKVSFNTHTVEFNSDLIKQALLYDDQSHYYKPISWTGGESSRHHREGILTFGSLDTSPKFVELKIKNVGGIPERVFRWDLK